MIETEIKHKLYSLARKSHDNIQFVPMENRLSIVGIPDLYFYSEDYENSYGWIEVKQLSRLKNKDVEIKIPYRPGQLTFITRHKKITNNIYVLLYIFETYHLINHNFRESYYDYSEIIGSSCLVTQKLNLDLIKILIVGGL